MSKVNRGEKILNRLVTEQKISPTGRDWLIAAIDPFHDAQLQNLEGWPDTECGASVVRCIKKSVTVAVPNLASFPAGQNWDCHIAMWPWMNGTTTFSQCTARRGNVIVGQALPNTAPFAPMGGIQIWAVQPGQNLDILQSVGSTVQVGRIDLDPIYTQGSGRLIGVGYEVHNTTAELYIQGSACCYRQQADVPFSSTYQIGGTNTAGGTYSGVLNGLPTRSPPINLGQAMLMSGSRQWTAAEGMYQVAAFLSEENPAYPVPPSTPIILPNGSDDQEGLAYNGGTSTVFYPTGQPIVNGFTFYPFSRVHPIHQSGSIFTGLSYQTTLTINVNFFYESFPSVSDVDILVLAKPSAIYDPCVMELYSRLVQELPVGVPVRENGLGDWFLQAASDAAKFIGPAIAALPHPIAKGAGAALTYLGNTGGDYVKRQQQPPNSWENAPGVSPPEAWQAMKTETRLMNAGAQIQKKKDKKKMKKKVAKAKAQAGQRR